MYTMMQVCRELDMTYQTLKFIATKCYPGSAHMSAT